MVETHNTPEYTLHSAASTITVKASPGTVHRIIISKLALQGTLSLGDDTTEIVHFPIGQVIGSYEVGCWFKTNIKNTLSDANDEVVIIWS